MTGIYKIVSPTGKIYIGQSRRLEFRYNQYRVMGCTNQTHLYRSLKKHGFDTHTFKIIHYLPDDIEQIYLDNTEQLYIDTYRAAGFTLLNIKGAGANGLHSAETKLKMSQTLKGRKTGKPSWNKGLKTPDHIKQKLSEAAKNRKFTPESAAILDQKRRARVPWNKGLKGQQVAWNKGVKFSDEVRQKMSKSAKCRKK